MDWWIDLVDALCLQIDCKFLPSSGIELKRIEKMQIKIIIHGKKSKSSYSNRRNYWSISLVMNWFRFTLLSTQLYDFPPVTLAVWFAWLFVLCHCCLCRLYNYITILQGGGNQRLFTWITHLKIKSLRTG